MNPQQVHNPAESPAFNPALFGPAQSQSFEAVSSQAMQAAPSYMNLETPVQATPVEGLQIDRSHFTPNRVEVTYTERAKQQMAEMAIFATLQAEMAATGARIIEEEEKKSKAEKKELVNA